MEWLTANWFWVIVFVLFIGMHLFGHGCHGGHEGHHGHKHGGEGEDYHHDESKKAGQHQH